MYRNSQSLQPFFLSSLLSDSFVVSCREILLLANFLANTNVIVTMVIIKRIGSVEKVINSDSHILPIT